MFVVTTGAFAQDLVNDAAKSAQGGDYDKAQVSIDQAVLDEKLASEAKTWYYYGFIYKQLYKTKQSTDPKSSFRKLSIDGLNKSIELDPKSEFAADCDKMIKYLLNTIYNDAVLALKAQAFDRAYDNYSQYVEINRKMDPTAVEDKVIFYTGYSAYMIKDFDNAIKYLDEVRLKDYNDPLLYFFMAKIYHDKNEVEKCFEILEEGKEKHPLAKDLNEMYISYKLERGQLTELETELRKAITLNPEDLEYRVTLALLYEKKAEVDRQNAQTYTDEAEKVYIGIIEKDPNHMRANYNLALLYYNHAVNIMNNMDDDDDDIFALNDIQEQCIQLFKKSLPYFNKAHELDPNNTEVLMGLGGVHFSLNDMEKSEMYNAKLKEIQEGKN